MNKDSAPVMYKTCKQSVVVGEHDVTIDTILMTPLKPGEQNADDIF